MAPPEETQDSRPNRFEQALGLFRQTVQESPEPVEQRSGGISRILRAPGRIAGAGASRVRRLGRAGASRGREALREAPVSARQALSVRGTGGIDEVLVKRFHDSVQRQTDLVARLGDGPESQRATEQLNLIDATLREIADPETETDEAMLAKFEDLLRQERDTRSELVQAIVTSGRKLSDSQQESIDTLSKETLARRLSDQAEAVKKTRREGKGLVGAAQGGVESGLAKQSIQLAGGAAFGPLFAILDDVADVSGKIQKGFSSGLGSLTRGREKRADVIRERTGQLGDVAARSLEDGGLPPEPKPERKPRKFNPLNKKGDSAQGDLLDGLDQEPVVMAVNQLETSTVSGFDRVEKTFKSSLETLGERTGEPVQQSDRAVRRKQDLEAEAKASVSPSVTKSREVDRRGRVLPQRDERGRFKKREAGGLASVVSTEINELEDSGAMSREKEINELQASNKATLEGSLDALREQDENQFEQSRLDARKSGDPLKKVADTAGKKETRDRQEKKRRTSEDDDGVLDNLLGGLVGGLVLGKFKGLAKGAGGFLKAGGAKGLRGLGGVGRVLGKTGAAKLIAGTAVGGAAIKGTQKLGGVLGSAKGSLGKVLGREAGEVAVKEGIEAAGKQGIKSVAAKGGAKAATKGLAKGGAKSLVKKIPLVGLLAGGVFAASRLARGDVKGAGLELASGAVSTLPGLGTAASVGIDAALIGRDIKKATEDKGISGIDFERAAKGKSAGRDEKREIIKRVGTLGLEGDDAALLQGKLFRASEQERKNFFEQTGGVPSLSSATASNPRPNQTIPTPPADPGIKVATSPQSAVTPSAQDTIRSGQFSVGRTDHDANQKPRQGKISLPFMIDHLGLVLISSGR